MITSSLANPFVLLLNPEEVLRAMQNSERLQGLQRRVFRPLEDSSAVSGLARDAASFDALIDGDLEEEDPM